MNAILWRFGVGLLGGLLGTLAAFGWVGVASLFAGEWIWHLLIPAVLLGAVAGLFCGAFVAGEAP